MLWNFIEQFFNKIKEYKKIALFVHMQPDFDAYACVFSLRKWILDNFEDMEVFVMIPPNTIEKKDMVLFQEIGDLPNNNILNDALGIVVDTPIRDRILTQSYIYCKELMLIDHHPKVGSFAQLEFIDHTYPSNSQILAEIFFHLEETKHLVFAPEVAQYLYAGLLTDTNNLMSLSMLPSTYQIISQLVLKGINRSLVHDCIFLQTNKQKLFNQKVVANVRITDNALAYTSVSKRTMKRYGMEKTPNVVTLIENIYGIEVWCALMYDFDKEEWKCSIRSKDLQINNIARKFGGGGHKSVSAVMFKRKRDFYKIIYALDEYLKQSGFQNASAYQKAKYTFWLDVYFLFMRCFWKDKYLK